MPDYTGLITSPVLGCTGYRKAGKLFFFVTALFFFSISSRFFRRQSPTPPWTHEGTALMGVASTKFAKQPTQAKSASQLKTQVKYVNEVYAPVFVHSALVSRYLPLLFR